LADFLDIFGEDFSSVLASLDELPPEVETMLLGVMDKMVYDVKTFSNSLEKSVYTMQQAGTSPKIIKQTLANDMGTGGRIFGQLRNDTKASIVDGINQSAKMGQYKNYDLDKGEFAWVAVGGHKVCMDCDGRAGQKMTFAGWEAEGLPGSGWSVCQGFCYCVLDPTGKASKKIDAPVKEPGPKVKTSKPTWKPSMTTKESSRWAKNSKVEGILYHGTPSKSLEGIGKSGFDLSKRSTGRLYGNGAYFTRNTVVAQGYGDGKMGAFMVNSKKHLSILSNDYWYAQMGKVDNVNDLTRGHEFMSKVKHGVLDEITVKHQKKYKYTKPDGSLYTAKELKDARMKDYNKSGGVKNDFYVKNLEGSHRRAGQENLSGEWFNYLETEYYAGNEKVIRIVDEVGLVGNFDDWIKMEDYSDVLTDFMTNVKGYESMEIRHANLPMGFRSIDPDLTTDTYTIVFDTKNITMIQD